MLTRSPSRVGGLWDMVTRGFSTRPVDWRYSQLLMRPRHMPSEKLPSVMLCQAVSRSLAKGTVARLGEDVGYLKVA